MAPVCHTTPEVIAALWGDGITNETVIRKFCHGFHTTEELCAVLERQFGVNLTPERLTELWVVGLGDVYQEVYDLYAALRARYGLRIVSCTDVDPIFGERLYRPGELLHNFFDEEVRSYLVGAVKPDRAMYEAALLKAGVLPEECFFVDDVARNVEGAKAKGMLGMQCTGEQVTKLRERLAEHGLVLS